jgi:hypothetical protein
MTFFLKKKKKILFLNTCISEFFLILTFYKSKQLNKFKIEGILSSNSLFFLLRFFFHLRI